MTSVLVFGSINMDVVTSCERHPRVGETVLGNSVAFHPGGKGANQAIAAARCLGASCLIGSVGADEFGKQMLAYLQENGVDIGGVAVESGTPTGVAVITVNAQGENSIVATPGANALAKAPPHLPASGSGALVALAQLESQIGEITRLFAAAKGAGGTTILNPSPYQSLPEELLQNTSIAILNEHEFALFIGRPATDEPQDIIARLQSAEFALPCCIITMGRAGCILAESGSTPIHIAGHKVDALDTTGAGDCFAGWFAGEIASGHALADGARRANAAAAISVTRAGAGSSMPSRSEVESFLRRRAAVAQDTHPAAKLPDEVT